MHEQAIWLNWLRNWWSNDSTTIALAGRHRCIVGFDAYMAQRLASEASVESVVFPDGDPHYTTFMILERVFLTPPFFSLSACVPHLNRMHALNGAAERVVCIVLRLHTIPRNPVFPFFLSFFFYIYAHLPF